MERSNYARTLADHALIARNSIFRSGPNAVTGAAPELHSDAMWRGDSLLMESLNWRVATPPDAQARLDAWTALTSLAMGKALADVRNDAAHGFIGASVANAVARWVSQLGTRTDYAKASDAIRESYCAQQSAGWKTRLIGPGQK